MVPYNTGTKHSYGNMNIVQIIVFIYINITIVSFCVFTSSE